MPFLVIDNYLPAYIIRSLQNKRTEVKDYCFLFKKFGNNKNNLVIPLRVNNIGIGLAIIENIQCSYKQLFASCKISDVSPIGSSKVIKKAGESIFLITVKNISQNQFKDLEFVIHFSDVQGNLYQTKFAIENIYNNEHINAELEHEILNKKLRLNENAKEIRELLADAIHDHQFSERIFVINERPMLEKNIL